MRARYSALEEKYIWARKRLHSKKGRVTVPVYCNANVPVQPAENTGRKRGRPPKKARKASIGPAKLANLKGVGRKDQFLYYLGRLPVKVLEFVSKQNGSRINH